MVVLQMEMFGDPSLYDNPVFFFNAKKRDRKGFSGSLRCNKKNSGSDDKQKRPPG